MEIKRRSKRSRRKYSHKRSKILYGKKRRSKRSGKKYLPKRRSKRSGKKYSPKRRSKRSGKKYLPKRRSKKIDGMDDTPRKGEDIPRYIPTIATGIDNEYLHTIYNRARRFENRYKQCENFTKKMFLYKATIEELNAIKRSIDIKRTIRDEYKSKVKTDENEDIFVLDIQNENSRLKEELKKLKSNRRNYFNEEQNINMFKTVVDWINEVIISYNLPRDYLFKTINYMKRYFCNFTQAVPLQKYQLLAITCLMMINKIDKRYDNDIKGSYSYKQLKPKSCTTLESIIAPLSYNKGDCVYLYLTDGTTPYIESGKHVTGKITDVETDFLGTIRYIVSYDFEVGTITVSNSVYLCDGGATSEEIRDKEIEILRILNFEGIPTPSPHDFFDIYDKFIDLNQNEKNMIDVLLEYGSFKFLDDILPSQLALSAILVAKRLKYTDLPEYFKNFLEMNDEDIVKIQKYQYQIESFYDNFFIKRYDKNKTFEQNFEIFIKMIFKK